MKAAGRGCAQIWPQGVIPGCRIEPARAVPSVAHYTTTFWTSPPTILFACSSTQMVFFTGSLRSEEISVVREYRAEF
jgi:hypothetical protein